MDNQEIRTFLAEESPLFTLRAGWPTLEGSGIDKIFPGIGLKSLRENPERALNLYHHLVEENGLLLQRGISRDYYLFTRPIGCKEYCVFRTQHLYELALLLTEEERKFVAVEEPGRMERFLQVMEKKGINIQFKGEVDWDKNMDRWR